VVWELWSLPRYKFILWLAMLKKLRTRDKIRFLPDTSCIFCQQEEENHSHLFFACSWSSLLLNKIKSWLHITRRMSNLMSAARGLHTTRKSLESRMKKVSLSLTVYLIWEERNKWLFDGSRHSTDVVLRKFQVLFYMVLHFHDPNHSLIHVG